MSQRAYVFAVAPLAVLGAGIAAYLTYAHYADARIACPTSGCETVQSSSYADIFGVPVALLGLVAYASILAGLALPPEAGRLLVLAAALAGFIFSAYLVAVQAFEIGSFCAWCLASDAIVTAIAVVASVRVRATLVEQSHAAP